MADLRCKAGPEAVVVAGDLVGPRTGDVTRVRDERREDTEKDIVFTARQGRFYGGGIRGATAAPMKNVAPSGPPILAQPP